MSMASITLAGRIWPASTTSSRLIRNVVLVLAGSVLLALSARVKVDLGFVPLSLQTLVVLSIGAAFGARLAGVTLLAYLAQGAAGLPVFAGTPEKGIGIAYMMGPTGGYLAGFLLAAIVVGYLAERSWDRNIISMAGAMLVGNALIYIPGLLWLGALIGWDKPVLEFGFYPFLGGDLIKLVIAAMAFPAVWNLIARLTPRD